MSGGGNGKNGNGGRSGRGRDDGPTPSANEGPRPTNPRLAAILDAIAERSHPPVHDWHPERSGEIDIRIAADGRWYHEGREIRRERLVRLFASVLRVDEDGETYLVTPVERLRIAVDDAHFVAVGLERHGAPDAQALVFRTNLDERVVADAAHPIVVEYATPDADPRPYLVVRDRLRALIARSVFLELAELVEERDGTLGVVSRETFMPLGPSGDAAG